MTTSDSAAQPLGDPMETETTDLPPQPSPPSPVTARSLVKLAQYYVYTEWTNISTAALESESEAEDKCIATVSATDGTAWYSSTLMMRDIDNSEQDAEEVTAAVRMQFVLALLGFNAEEAKHAAGCFDVRWQTSDELLKMTAHTRPQSGASVSLFSVDLARCSAEGAARWTCCVLDAVLSASLSQTQTQPPPPSRVHSSKKSAPRDAKPVDSASENGSKATVDQAGSFSVKQKEKKRLEKERVRAEKQAEKERKEAERVAQKELKLQQEQERREAEKKRKEDDKVKPVAGSVNIMSTFFKKLDRKKEDAPPAADEASAFDAVFRPFVMRKDVTLADSNRFLPDAPATWTLQELCQDGTTVSKQEILASLRALGCKRPGRPVEKVRIPAFEAEVHMPMKLLQFAEDHRPPYWGTWSKDSIFVTGHHPLAKDAALDYEYDSEAEWEEEGEGDEIKSDDEEDADDEDDDEDGDDGFFVKDGYISNVDDAGDDDDDDDDDMVLRRPVTQPARKKVRSLDAVILGPFFASHTPPHTIVAAMRVTLVSASLPIDPTVAPAVVSVESVVPQLAAAMDGGTAVKLPVRRHHFSDQEVADIARHIHGSQLGMRQLVEELRSKLTSHPSKVQLEARIKDISVKERRKSMDHRVRFFVKPDILAALSIGGSEVEDLLTMKKHNTGHGNVPAAAPAVLDIGHVDRHSPVLKRPRPDAEQEEEEEVSAKRSRLDVDAQTSPLSSLPSSPQPRPSAPSSPAAGPASRRSLVPSLASIVSTKSLTRPWQEDEAEAAQLVQAFENGSTSAQDLASALLRQSLQALASVPVCAVQAMFAIAARDPLEHRSVLRVAGSYFAALADACSNAMDEDAKFGVVRVWRCVAASEELYALVEAGVHSSDVNVVKNTLRTLCQVYACSHPSIRHARKEFVCTAALLHWRRIAELLDSDNCELLNYTCAWIHIVVQHMDKWTHAQYWELAQSMAKTAMYTPKDDAGVPEEAVGPIRRYAALSLSLLLADYLERHRDKTMEQTVVQILEADSSLAAQHAIQISLNLLQQ
ncbi:hypothetical protein RI367_001177 [Sorochytrium milnesiophthora]